MSKTKNTVLFTLLLYLLFFFCSCSDNKEKTFPSTSENGSMSTVHLNAKTLPSISIDSLVILATGSDTIHQVIYDDKTPVEMQLFPNAPWRFYAGLYAQGGILMQEGSVEMELQAGEDFYVEIPLKAIVGFVYVEIPIGFDNEMQIASGSLNLSSKKTNKTYTLKQDGPIAYFSSDALPLNTKYYADMILKDIYGDTIFIFKDSISIYDNNPVFQWKLTSLRSSVSLSLEAQVIEPNEFYAFFSRSKKRYPNESEIIFTEIFVTDKFKSAEYIELFNGSLDSLILDSCYITTKSSSNSGALIPENTVIRPSSFLTIGGDSVFDANIKLSSFDIVNTKQALVLQCKNQKIDSVIYSSTDTLNIDTISIDKNKSAQLPLRFWNEKNDFSKWCLEEQSIGEDALCK